MRLRDQIIAVACLGWVSILGLGIYFACSADSYSRAGVIREGSAGGTRLADPGAQDAQSRTRTELPRTGESRRQSVGSPGHASESPRDVSFLSVRLAGSSDRNAGAEAARSQGVRLAPAEKLTRSLTEEARRGHFQPYVLTAYSHTCILPKWGPEPPPQPMASGEWPVAGLHVAGPPEMAFGTVLEVVYRGLPSRLIVGDRGRAIKGRRLDLFLATCRAARAWGRRTAYVREVSE